ncbi:MAG: nuclear transport factor 2 family protein [Bacteroidetes bacterium]|nr:nuclear transport factor 2 family protein [Bacteroidota bacterium]
MRKLAIVLFATALFTNCIVAQIKVQSTAKDSLIIETQLKGFVDALRNLDADQLKNYFSNDATVFFPPSAMVAGRIKGRDSIMVVFKSFFDRVKKNRSGPPYLDIDPQKIQTDIVGNMAITSFELIDPDAISRRTVVMKKEKNNWLIFHLHASKINN